MATVEDRLKDLEVRVDHLETWAGPGQAEALAEGQRQLRAEFAKMRVTQDRHTRMLTEITADVSGLKTDVAGLKTDMADVKSTVQEILRRLPPPPADV
jgi:hypothetical protein